MIGINAKKKGAVVKVMLNGWTGKARNGAAIISKQYLDGSRLKPKKKAAFVKQVAKQLVLLAIRRAEKVLTRRGGSYTVQVPQFFRSYTP